VGYCYPSRLEKTLCKWDIYMVCPTGHKRVNRYELSHTTYKKECKAFVTIQLVEYRLLSNNV